MGEVEENAEIYLTKAEGGIGGGGYNINTLLNWKLCQQEYKPRAKKQPIREQTFHLHSPV